MARSYTKFNSTRSKAEFARNALASPLVATDATSAVEASVGSTTGWADANSKVTLNTGSGVFGDAGDWSETTGGNVILQPGTYDIEYRIAVKNTSGTAATLHFALTDDAYAVLFESNLSVPLIISNQNENGWLCGYLQLELAAETAVAAHVGVSGPQVCTKVRGENSQIIFRKLA